MILGVVELLYILLFGFITRCCSIREKNANGLIDQFQIDKRNRVVTAKTEVKYVNFLAPTQVQNKSFS